MAGDGGGEEQGNEVAGGLENPPAPVPGPMTYAAWTAESLRRIKTLTSTIAKSRAEEPRREELALDEIAGLGRLAAYERTGAKMVPRRATKGHVGGSGDDEAEAQAASLAEQQEAQLYESLAAGGNVDQKLLPAQVAMLARVLHLAMRGKAGKAMDALKSSGLVELTDENVARLRALYPNAYSDGASVESDGDGEEDDEASGGSVGGHEGHDDGTEEETKEQKEKRTKLDGELALALAEPLRLYLQGRAPETAPGMSGLTYDHFKLVFDTRAPPLECKIETLAALVVQILRGRFNTPKLRAALTTQRGVALAKPDATPRPVGILETLTRLASGTLVSFLQTPTTANPTPLLRTQLAAEDVGSGVPGGTEALVHAVRAKLALQPDAVAIKCDTKNAFNSVSREAVFEAVKKVNSPPLDSFADWLYGAPSAVVYESGGRSVRIVNAEGVIQGDGLSSWLFDIAFSRALKEVRANPAYSDTVILALHDDLYIVGPADQVFAALNDVWAATGRLHLIAQPIKSQALCLSSDDNVVAAATEAAAQAGVPLSFAGFVVAGAPVGTPEFMREHVQREVAEAKEHLELLVRAVTQSAPLPHGMPAVQAIMRTIRMCIAPSLVYTARTVPPEITTPYLRLLDRAVFDGVMTVLGQPAANPDTDASASLARLRLHLPIAKGGMGFIRLEDAAQSAYVGSFTLTGKLVRELASLDGRTLSTEHVPSLAAALGALQARQGAAAIQSLQSVTVESLLAGTVPRGDGPAAHAGGGGAHMPAPEDVHEDAPDPSLRAHRKLMPASQAQIGEAISTQRQREVLEALPTDQAKTVFVSGSGPGSGAWVTAPPTGKTAIRDDDFRHLAAIRLGLPIRVPDVVLPPNAAPLECLKCGKTMDLSGDHAFQCRHITMSGVQNFRHNDICNGVKTLVFDDPLARAVLRAELEVPVSATFPPKPGAPKGTIKADLLVTHRHKPETRLVDITVTYPNVAKHSSSNTIGGRGTAAKAAEEVKDAWYNKRAIIPAGTLVPVAFETYGTLGARGDAYLRDIVRNYVRPVTWLDAPADKGPKFVDHGGRYSIFLRRLRELISVTLQRGNAAFIRKWLDNCVPKSAAAQGDLDAEDAGAAALEGA